MTTTHTHLEHLQQVLLLYLETDKWLLLLDDGFEERLEISEVTRSYLLAVQKHVIVVATVDGWTIAQAAAIVPLHGLSEDVSARVPEHLLTWLVRE